METRHYPYNPLLTHVAFPVLFAPLHFLCLVPALVVERTFEVGKNHCWRDMQQLVDAPQAVAEVKEGTAVKKRYEFGRRLR
jgi:hypothetical protein